MSAAGPGRWLLATAGVVVVAVLAVALGVIGSPTAQRLVRLDERREGELARIENAVAVHWDAHARLPADLAVLASQPGIALRVSDPVDDQAYGYEVLGPRAYRLCAVFATDTAVRAGHDDRWAHAVGRHCFDRSVEAGE